MPGGITFKKELSVGTVIQLIGLIAAAILFFDRSENRQKQIILELQQARTRLERVEKYLSSKDPRYWELIHNMSLEEDVHGITQLNRTAAIE